MLPQDAGETLKNYIQNKSTVCAVIRPLRPMVDVAEVFLWLMAVGTILSASYWSAWSAKDDANEREKLLKEDSVEYLNTENAAGSSGYVEISTAAAILFVVVASWLCFTN